jgi:molybdopterin molybdotransferase
MIEVTTAMDLIHDSFFNLHIKTLSINSINKKMASQEIYAERDQPPFDRVTMDGIAVFWANQKSFLIENIQRAGEAAKLLSNKSNAIEAMTGSCLPIGCDTVIPYEHIKIDNNIATISEDFSVKKKQNIHAKGKDYKKGELVLPANSFVHSPVMAVVTSQGITKLKVSNFPKIAIISTGDELIDPGKLIEDFQIRKSNPYSLSSELESFGIPKESIDLFHINDDKNILIEKFKKILEEYKILIISGGVSKGKFDFVHSIMNDIKVKTIFHKIKQKPGKPMLFGTGESGQCIFGLPGNPVSSLICLRRYIVEAFKAKLNLNQSGQQHAILTQKIEFKKKLTMFIPVTIEYNSQGQTLATPVKGNGSGDFYSLAKTDGFLELSEEKEVFLSGDAYPIYLWSGMN